MDNAEKKHIESLCDEKLARVEALPEQHRRVLELRYPVYDLVSSSYQQTAFRLSISAERAEELECEALRMMREPDRHAVIGQAEARLRVRLKKLCWAAAHGRYGEWIHPKIRERLDRELEVITRSGQSRVYLIAHEVAKECGRLGAPHIARGCTGASFAAYLLGITEGDPLPPHLYCPQCGYTDFETCFDYVDRRGQKRAVSGIDVYSIYNDEFFCSECGRKMEGEGNDLPFEAAAGLDGEKQVRFDISVPPQIYREVSERFAELMEGDELLGVGGDADRFAETCNTVTIYADTALARLYELQQMIDPWQYPIPIGTTLEKYRKKGLDLREIPFLSKLSDISSKTFRGRRFADLVRFLGGIRASFRTDESEEELFCRSDIYRKCGIAHREDVMQTLMRYGVERDLAFRVARAARRGEAYRLSEAELRELREKGVPGKYIYCMRRILYLFPRAHSTEYAIKIIKLMWYRLNYPKEFAEAGRGYDGTEPSGKEGDHDE